MRVLFYILAGSLLACESPKPPASSGQTASPASAAKPELPPESAAQLPANIRRLEGPMPGPETELARVGEYRVSLAEFEKSVRMGSLFGPNAAKGTFDPVPPDRLATPTVHFTTTQAALSRQIVDQEIKRRGILITQPQIEAFYRSKPFPGFVWLLDHPDKRPQVLESLQLSEPDFWEVGYNELAHAQLTELLLAEISEDELWSAWAFDHDRVTVATVMLDNVPTSDEIDRFVEKESKAIEAYFKANEAKYRQPMRVIVDTLVSSKKETSRLEDAKQQLQNGADIMDVALKTGLEVQQNVRLIRQENTRAFHGQPGDIGLEQTGPRGAYVWRVTGFEKSDATELNRGLRREIAAELLRTNAPTPTVARRLADARKHLASIVPEEPATFDKAQKAIEALGLSIHVGPSFSKNPNGSVPEFGLAPEVLEAAFQLTIEKPTSDVILSRQRAFVLQLLKRETPDKTAYEADKTAWKERYMKQLKPTIVDRFVQAKVGNPVLNLRPLAIKYGILNKE